MGFGALELVFWFQSVSVHADSCGVYTRTVYLFESLICELTYLSTTVVVSNNFHFIKELR